MMALKSRKDMKKNKKGFSLVELIVVLVIMAILIAALVPSLIGYIKQARQSNSTNEAASCVQAAQTIASSAYADPSGQYQGKDTGNVITISGGTLSGSWVAEVQNLAEVDGTPANVVVSDGKVTGLTYTAANGDVVTFNSTGTPKYSVS